MDLIELGSKTAKSGFKNEDFVKDELKNVKEIDFFQDSPQWYIDILVKNPDILIQKLRKHGIQARRFYRPLHQQPLYKNKKSHCVHL